MSGPLEGLKVLDIATIIAAPFAATLLADYGADVLKIEMPGHGDGVRSFPPFKDGKPLWWKAANRNKQFATLDLRTPEGLALFKRLLPRFDVLIENFRPGTLDRWGLSKEVLWSIQPRLVILRATAFGLIAPWLMGHIVDVGVNPAQGFRDGFLFAGLLIVAGGALAMVIINPKDDIRRFARRDAATTDTAVPALQT